MVEFTFLDVIISSKETKTFLAARPVFCFLFSSDNFIAYIP